MSKTKDTETTISTWKRALFAGERTPESRNRYADFLRAVSIGAVVIGHWLMVAPFVQHGQLQLDHILHIAPGTVWLTWAFQVMPVFFMVGGYSNAASWESAQRKGQGYDGWLAARLNRLMRPLVPLVLVWVVLGMVARFSGITVETFTLGSKSALVPTWFLAVYIMIVVTAPLSHWAWRRAGIFTFWSLVLCALGIDIVGLSTGYTYLRWLNYAFVWLAVHQLGYLWWAGRHGSPVALLLWSSGALFLLLLLINFAGYPVSMISVPGVEMSNSRPPTIALIALAVLQGGLLVSLEKPMRRWLSRVRPWAVTIVVNQSIMTIYLWHMTVMILAVGLLDFFDGAVLAQQPGTWSWWLNRPLWLGGLGRVLLVFALVLSRFEQVARKSGTGPVPAWRAMIGAAMVCLGLAQAAISGIGAAGVLGVDVWTVLLILTGVGLVSHNLRLSAKQR